PACNDYLVCQEVCAVLPECCDVEWDIDCVKVAEDLCTGCGAPCNGPCTEARPDRPGCRNEECCELVCEFNPRCCQIAWDASCADLARDVCLECGTPAAGNCCLARYTPFCNDRDCCETVCTTLDPYCCDTQWDSICANEAATICGGCGTGASCYQAHATPGCADQTCCATICALDPFCCDSQWDSICVNGANASCKLGDLNGDNLVNAADLSTLLSKWGQIGSGDLNGDGTTNAADLSTLLSKWGT
ncbi:MAG: dockerin type I domain-containing protein, partial [Phycisphaerales bacterium]